MRTSISLFAVCLLLVGASRLVTLADDGKRNEEPKAKVDPEDAKLFAYLEQRVADEEVLKRVDSLIRQLGDADFDNREEASNKLLHIGVAALPKLQLALKSDDTEVARRAKACVEKIEKESKENGTPGEVVYRLLMRHPAGTVEALVNFLPHAEEDAVEEAIYFGLSKLLEQDKMLVAILLPALKDKLAPRRALAGLLVSRYGNEEQRTAARKLLDDADATVRLRTAQGLLGAEDKAGIPMLIALLNQTSTTLAWQAEELLCWVGGEDSPKPRIGAGNAVKKKECQQGWQAWWKQEEKHVDLKRVMKAYRRPFLLLLRQHVERGGDKILLLGADGSTRWESLPASIGSVQLLPGDRVLTAEGSSGAVERDFDGTIRWSNMTLEFTGECRRLLNGHTILVAPEKDQAEITKDGTVVFHKQYDAPRMVRRRVLTPYLLSTGRLCFVEDGIVEIEPRTCEVAKRIRPVDALDWIDRYEPLQSGGCFVVVPKSNVFLELDVSGKTVKKWDVPAPVVQAKRLPNGTTLVSTLLNGQNYIVVLDTKGRTVWETCIPDIQELQDGLSLVQVGFGWPDADDVDLATSIPLRVAQIHSKDPDQRCYGAFGLGRMKGQEAAVTPRLLDLFLHDSDENVRKIALSYLKEKARVEELPLFLKAAKDSRPEVRLAIFEISGCFSSKPDEFAPVLIEALQDKDVLLRRQAATSLVHFPSHPKVLPAAN